MAVSWVSGNLNFTSAQFFCWQRCPNPTVGRPTGSGLGLATKPSNSLIKLTVAALTGGGAQARASSEERTVSGSVKRFLCTTRSVELTSCLCNYKGSSGKKESEESLHVC